MEAVIEAAIKTVILQGIDPRLHSRMLVPLSNKLIRVLESLLFFTPSSFFRQHHQSQDLLKLRSVYRSVEVLIKTAATQLREPFFCRPYEGNRYLLVRGLPHNHVVQNKPILILYHTYLQSQLLRHSGFALGDPLRMLFKDRKNLLLVRDLLSVENPPAYLSEKRLS